jgi:uncharacterized SAM-binding protein YcdF (DUF218 family)
MVGTAAMKRPVLVILGAAVSPDGRPGPAVVRRVRTALRVGVSLRAPLYLPTGGPRQGGPAEAEVMAQLLSGAGVPRESIIVDARSLDTLQSVVNCVALIAPLDATDVIVCTDGYHLPRCRILFRLAGLETQAAPVAADLDTVSWPRRIFYWLREVVALPFDVILLLGRRYRHA